MSERGADFGASILSPLIDYLPATPPGASATIRILLCVRIRRGIWAPLPPYGQATGQSGSCAHSCIEAA